MSSGLLQNAHSKGKTWHTMDNLHFKNATKKNGQIIIIRAVCLLLSMRQYMLMHGYSYGCLHLSVCSHVCEHVRRGGLGGRSEKTELLWGVMNLCLPLLPRTGTATCPNCKENERIKESEFGCDCNEEEENQLWLLLYLEHFGSHCTRTTYG